MADILHIYMAVIKNLSNGIAKDKQERWSNTDNSVQRSNAWSKFRRGYIQYRLSQGHADCDICKAMFKEQYRTIAGKVVRTQGIEIDHVKPISEGGNAFDYDNLQMLCPTCHKRKTIKEINMRK